MSADLIGLPGKKLPVELLLHQMLERNDIEATVLAMRCDGRWTTHWAGDLTGGSLAMAAMKIFRDISDENEAK